MEQLEKRKCVHVFWRKKRQKTENITALFINGDDIREGVQIFKSIKDMSNIKIIGVQEYDRINQIYIGEFIQIE